MAPLPLFARVQPRPSARPVSAWQLSSAGAQPCGPSSLSLKLSARRAPSPTVVLASSSLGALPARLRTFPRRELALYGARSFPAARRALCRAELLTMALLLPAESSPSSVLFHGAQPTAP
ncbi:hypothetical protein Zm00014a_027983 [Zea mays]|uniref:Uncharacterized protein n=2 Tax=Zea mays TaxID=4577 RepID=A0A3L6F7D0_MAIZE|nr:hypothetical protein ZEAMMB73_Zm00001d050231 [Zea mays]PWZ28231.1 hypothetical protein Zm00014a_027983 [Zea mays]